MHKRNLILVVVSLAACLSGRAEVARSVAPNLEDALVAWRKADLDGAVAALQLAVAADSGDADAQAWLAEGLRRQGDSEGALDHARLALAADPHHAMALAVMGDLHNPQFPGDETIQDRDECIRLYRAALATDPYDLQALLGLCVWGVRIGDGEMAGGCLTAMVEGGVWTEPLMALARWMLESTPPEGILLLNGDADSFPIWVLQAQGVRPDVLTCNLSLLNLDDYRGRLALAGLPVPPVPLQHELDGEGGVHTISMQVLENLGARIADGSCGRPLAIATTVSTESLTEDLARYRHLRGGVFVFDPEEEIEIIDLTATRQVMGLVPPGLLAGPWTSARERSPVRLQTNPYLRFNPMAVASNGFQKATTLRDRESADWFRDLYLAYREELGPFNGDHHFDSVEAEYQEWTR